MTISTIGITHIVLGVAIGTFTVVGMLLSFFDLRNKRVFTLFILAALVVGISSLIEPSYSPMWISIRAAGTVTLDVAGIIAITNFARRRRELLHGAH